MSLHKVATLADLPPGAALSVTVEARDIGLFNVKGDLLAVKNLCPHRGDQLHKGQVTAAGRVVCPGHAWHFDLRTGSCTSGNPDARVRTYPVVVSDGDIYIEV